MAHLANEGTDWSQNVLDALTVEVDPIPGTTDWHYRHFYCHSRHCRCHFWRSRCQMGRKQCHLWQRFFDHFLINRNPKTQHWSAIWTLKTRNNPTKLCVRVNGFKLVFLSANLMPWLMYRGHFYDTLFVSQYYNATHSACRLLIYATLLLCRGGKLVIFCDTISLSHVKLGYIATLPLCRMPKLVILRHSPYVASKTRLYLRHASFAI